MPLLLGFSLAGLIGLALGLLGGGGSILTVPILVYALGFSPKQGIALGLAVVGVTSLVGAISQWRRGNVKLKAAATFAGVAMLGTYGGARLSAFIPGAVQLVLFAAVMLVAAFFMQRNARRPLPALEAVPVVPRSRPLILGISALAVGALTGIAGVGGGFLIVPALVLLAGLPMKQAVGTSLVVISLNSLVGFAGYQGQVEVPWAQLAVFTTIAVGGILLGTWASHHVSQARLKSAFSVLLVVMGVFILFKNRNVFQGTAELPAVTQEAPDLRQGSRQAADASGADPYLAIHGPPGPA
ncbi:MAG: sulfite exporter TauE/SafE family protein [Myxococcota bacterium]|nr:sulfite exporter TauE/SafE family protein [Myxococcota bacterium]